jgi:hypothetical protein
LCLGVFVVIDLTSGERNVFKVAHYPKLTQFPMRRTLGKYE